MKCYRKVLQERGVGLSTVILLLKLASLSGHDSRVLALRGKDVFTW